MTRPSSKSGDALAFRWRPGRGPVAEGAAAELLPVVWGLPAGRVRAQGDDPGRVHRPVDDVVVLLDLREVDGVAEPRCLEQVARVGPQHRHLGQLLPVALEVAVVDPV